MSSGERERSRAFAIRMSPAQVAKQAAHLPWMLPVCSIGSESRTRFISFRSLSDTGGTASDGQAVQHYQVVVVAWLSRVAVAQKKLECNHPE